MNKIYYPYEDQLRNIAKAYGVRLPKGFDGLDDDGLDAFAEKLSPFVRWIEHPDYSTLVPVDKETGKVVGGAFA